MSQKAFSWLKMGTCFNCRLRSPRKILSLYPKQIKQGNFVSRQGRPAKRVKTLLPVLRAYRMESMLQDLPDEIILFILSFLDSTSDLLSVSQTCKQLYDIACDNALWVPIFKSRVSIQRVQSVRFKGLVAADGTVTMIAPSDEDDKKEAESKKFSPWNSFLFGKLIMMRMAHTMSAKSALEIMYSLKKKRDVNIWNDIAGDLQSSLQCEFRTAETRNLVCASLNTVVRRLLHLEDPWLTWPESNTELFCAMLTCVQRKVLFYKLVEAASVNAFSFHGFKTRITTIHLLQYRQGVVPNSKPKSPNLCSVCGKKIIHSNICSADPAIEDIKHYVQDKVIKCFVLWLKYYPEQFYGKSKQSKAFLDVLHQPWWLEEIRKKIKDLVKAIKFLAAKPLPTPPNAVSSDFEQLFDKVQRSKQLAIQLTKDDADMYRSVPSHEIQSAALLAASGCCFSLILDRSPWLRQVVNRGRCLTEFVVKTTRTIEKKGKQVAFLRHCIQICDDLYQLKNYASLRAIITAIRASVVDPQTTVSWKSFSYRDCKSFAELEKAVLPVEGSEPSSTKTSDLNQIQYLPTLINAQRTSEPTETPPNQPKSPPPRYAPASIVGIPAQQLISSSGTRALFPLRPLERHIKAAKVLVSIKPDPSL